MARKTDCSKCGKLLDGSNNGYCKLCYNEWKRNRYASNREKEVARAMEYNYRNYDKFKENLREYRSTEAWKATARKWKDDNADLCRQYDRTKRARRKLAEGSHTKEDVAKILERQKWKCAECKASLKKAYHVDHIMPLALGGSNWPRNLQCLCPSCNVRKFATHPIDWARKNGRLV